MRTEADPVRNALHELLGAIGLLQDWRWIVEVGGGNARNTDLVSCQARVRQWRRLVAAVERAEAALAEARAP